MGKLTHQEQKQVKITSVDLALDPKGSGLSLERITKTRDEKLWSARVSRDLRIIMRRDGDDTLLAYVGHHDDAYNWAERRRIIPHERTGAMQIVELTEKVEESRPDYYENAPKEATPAEAKRQPFWGLQDDELLDVGVPRDWLQPVREWHEDDLDSIFHRLPAEAAEALYDFATGGKLEDHIVQPAEPGSDPFAHPDAQRRFRIMDNMDELQAALDAPFEKWAVFLHPAQRELVVKQVTGPTRVTGSAGTGKTIVALHRAVHLASEDGSARVLLTTFSQPLANSLAIKCDLLCEMDSDLRKQISVQPLDEAVRELYVAEHGKPDVASAVDIRVFIGEAFDAGMGAPLTIDFLLEEWEELVDAWGVDDPDQYAKLPRVGRRTRLGSQQREVAWQVFKHIRNELASRGLVTWPMIYNSMAEQIGARGEVPFDHIVVDEAQDLSVAQVRFLGEVAKLSEDALFLAGDIGQRIFRLPFSWTKLGLDVRGRSKSLKVNYRTSHQIRAMADRLLPPSITDMDGIEEGRRGTVSIFDGPQPHVLLAKNQDEELRAVSSWLRSSSENEIAPERIGILVRGEKQFKRAEAAIDAAKFDPSFADKIAIATMHDAKGLEFSAVAVMACDEDVLPDPERLTEIGDVAELETAYETERHLLYVACTRARDNLMVSGVEPGSEFLDDFEF